jgi:hypothetical protein
MVHRRVVNDVARRGAMDHAAMLDVTGVMHRAVMGALVVTVVVVVGRSFCDAGCQRGNAEQRDEGGSDELGERAHGGFSCVGSGLAGNAVAGDQRRRPS